MGPIPIRGDRRRSAWRGALQWQPNPRLQFCDSLPGWLSRLGLQANVSVNDAQSRSQGASFTTPGVSKTACNLIGRYEKSGWSARLACNWRSHFVDTCSHGGPGLDLIVQPLKRFDVSLACKIDPHTRFILEATHLLDSEHRDPWKDPAVYPRGTRRCDRAFAIGQKRQLQLGR